MRKPIGESEFTFFPVHTFGQKGGGMVDKPLHKIVIMTSLSMTVRFFTVHECAESKRSEHFDQKCFHLMAVERAVM